MDSFTHTTIYQCKFEYIKNIKYFRKDQNLETFVLNMVFYLSIDNELIEYQNFDITCVQFWWILKK
jgi:hypothetical protein